VTLETEIDEQRKIIQTDSYPISVGELISMYNEKELFITNHYQPLRSKQQKARDFSHGMNASSYQQNKVY